MIRFKRGRQQIRKVATLVLLAGCVIFADAPHAMAQGNGNSPKLRKFRFRPHGGMI